jgi:CRP/FNR family cyclic AMP-dependent transcriptional regulator
MGRPLTCQLLAEDPELAEYLEGERRSAAIRECVTEVLVVRPGAWSPPGLDGPARGIGLLVLDGLIVRHVGLAGRFGAELIGAGDVVCPWQWAEGDSTLPRAARWRVLQNTRLAVLDSDLTLRLGRYPEVFASLFTRALQRSRHVAVNMAIVQQPRIDVRLQMLFWELADRFGRVRQDGVHIPIALTHATLADLVAARRPTVTKALGELAERSAIVWTGEDWLLLGDPPAQFEEVEPVSAVTPPGVRSLRRPARR